MLIALDSWLGPASELVLIGGSDEAKNQEAITAIQQSFLPRSVVAYRHGSPDTGKTSRSAALESLFAGRLKSADQPLLYVCENFACQAPVKGVAQIKSSIARL